MGGKVLSEQGSGVEELRDVLSTVSDFLSILAPRIREILDAVFEQFSGEKIGREVTALYKQLKSSGMDDELVKEMTIKFFDQRTAVLGVIKEVIESIRGQT